MVQEQHKRLKKGASKRWRFVFLGVHREMWARRADQLLSLKVKKKRNSDYAYGT